MCIINTTAMSSKDYNQSEQANINVKTNDGP